MKKIIYLVIIAISIATFVVVFATAKHHNKVLSITTIKKGYCFVDKFDEQLEFSIPLYADNKDSFITDFDLLEQSRLTDKDNIIKIDCLRINNTTQAITVNNKQYFLCDFYFRLPLEVDSEYSILLNQAKLELDYKYEQLIIDIGSFTYSKIPYYGTVDDSLMVSKLKPIVNYAWNNKTLVGLVMGFTNNTSYDITIEEIDFLSGPVVPSYIDVMEAKEEISSNDKINKLLGYQYQIDDGVSLNNKPIKIEDRTTLELVVPLKYNQEIIIEKLGLKIDYQVNGKSMSLYYDDFTYFRNLDYYVEDVTIYTYDIN